MYSFLTSMVGCPGSPRFVNISLNSPVYVYVASNSAILISQPTCHATPDTLLTPPLSSRQESFVLAPDHHQYLGVLFVSPDNQTFFCTGVVVRGVIVIPAHETVHIALDPCPFSRRLLQPTYPLLFTIGNCRNMAT